MRWYSYNIPKAEKKKKERTDLASYLSTAVIFPIASDKKEKWIHAFCQKRSQKFSMNNDNYNDNNNPRKKNLCRLYWNEDERVNRIISKGSKLAQKG